MAAPVTTRRDDRPSTIHSVITTTKSSIHPGELTVKFRCERDVLAEALGAAGRAATGRAAGALPVLSGVRLEVSGDRLLVTGTDLELTIEQELQVDGQGDGGCVLPARLATDIVRSLGDPK